jgi:hypothetical protein
MGGRLETADRWGRWDNQRESGHGGGGGERPTPTALAHGAERGSGQAWADRRGPPVRHTGRAT